ncbi:MAG: DUF1501 domain-containing protein [Flavobacteriaceae bacterium]
MCNHHKHIKIQEDAHSQEHKKWNRRSFLQALGLVGGGTMLLSGSNITASNPSPLAQAISNSDSENILVLIRLKGGNDGLNTIVPIFDYDNYANLRPTLRFEESDLIQLNPDIGIPNFMSDLESMWGEGAMKVVHGVGYNNASLSHFEGSDIWANTDEANDEQTGWLGRYFEEVYPDYLSNPPEIPAAIQIGSIGNLIFDGADNNYAFSVANPDQLESIAENGTLYNMSNLPLCTYGDQLRFLRGTTNTTFNYSGIIHEAYANSSNEVDYGNGQLGNQLAIVARMIKGNLGTKVYMVTLGGFDTHANQADKHQQLLTDLSESVKLFFDDIASTGHADKVLGMTFSEFGRRPDENGSAGTDHGAGAPLLLFGEGLNGNGFIGDHPSLTNLDTNGNLEFSTDFRQVYASIMENWLCIDNLLISEALLGTSYDSLDLGLICTSTLSNNTASLDDFNHFVYHDRDQTILKINNKYTQHTVIKLYNILGVEVATLKNEMLLTGTHLINIKSNAKRHLNTGQYIYRISSGGKHYSKSILIL